MKKIVLSAALLFATSAQASPIWQRLFHHHPVIQANDTDAYGTILSAAAEAGVQALATIGGGIGSVLAIAGGTDASGAATTAGTCTLEADATGHYWCQYQGTWYLYGGNDATTGAPIYYYQTAAGWVRA